ncbi:sensor histidine kinase [Hymenobacter sp. BT730]|uniref:sensor histidine kinase n=1 Tax=Hymenobacter sp. BT730 TaxID=3063332 RepID=UPI0026E0598D|nr:histidine kinase [Hymenobacter sp. BT730]
MAFFTPRQAQAGLLHAVVWGLLGVLLFTQPSHSLPQLPFYLLQSALFVVCLGVFYLNLGWAVPQLLYRRRVLVYLLFLILVVSSVVFPYRALRNLLAPPRPSANWIPANGAVPGAATGLPPRPNREPGRRSGLVDPAVLLSTLLVLGLSTSIAAVQRGQRDAQIRQALEQEKLSTELSWLKAQINPHFFFNTLNNIYALTLMNGDQAREAIHRLSRMMRYVLYETQSGTAPLSQELQFVHDYIDLMQLRLTDNVTVEFEVPEPLRDVSIAPMLLLTFVENAFKHGVSALEPSRIRIAVQQPLPHMLDVTVQNTVFLDRPVALDENSGIGLANTRRRLQLLYPGRHTLTITESTPGHEYRVHLTLDLLS